MMTTHPQAALSAESVDARFSILTEALDRHLPKAWEREQTNRGIPLNLILHCVARTAGMSVESLLARTREERTCRARQVAMFLVRELTTFSFPQIAREFRKNDHTTPMYAFKVVRERMAADPAEAERIASLRKSIEDVYADLRATAEDPDGGERAKHARQILFQAA